MPLGRAILPSTSSSESHLLPPFGSEEKQNQPRDEYEQSTGRGADEPLSDYISRMAGIYTLYLAILQTPLASIASAIPSPQTPEQLVRLIPPILRFPASWTWLAFALRDPLPALAPTAQLVTVWIEIVGAEAIRLYSAPQVGKVFDVIMREGLEGGKLKGDSEATRQRLKLLLEGWRENVKPHPAREWT